MNILKAFLIFMSRDAQRRGVAPLKNFVGKKSQREDQGEI
jgi:hypothetical protein